jgi:hypothetical protein
MAQRDLGRTHLLRNPIQHAASKAGAQRTRCGVCLQQIVHHFANRRVLDAQIPTTLTARARDQIVLVLLIA